MSTEYGIEYFNELYSQDELIIQKAKAFDKIADMFYKRNFGSATKSEIELLMFSIFMDAMISKHTDNGTQVLNYNECSDYKIGKILGITQEKVRTLKVKKQARYPEEFDWRESLMSIQDQIRYDDEKKKIIIPASDPNLYNEIRNFIEEKGGYIEIQRGQNCIQMRPEYFFILLYNGVEDENDKKKIREEFAKKLRGINESNNVNGGLTDNEVSKMALELGDSAFDILRELANGIQNPLIGIIDGIQVLGKIVRKVKYNG